MSSYIQVKGHIEPGIKYECYPEGEYTKLQAEIAGLKDTNRRLNRRCQQAEAAAGELNEWRQVAAEQRTGRYLPAMMAFAVTKLEDEIARLKDEQALKERP